MHYSYSITHVPGKLLYTADTLSRAAATNSTKDLISLQEEAEVLIDSAIQCLPTTGEKLKVFSGSQASDAEVLSIWVARETQGYRQHQTRTMGYCCMGDALLSQ